MHRAQAANHDQQQQLDRLQQAELVRRDELQLVRIQGAGNAGDGRRQRERGGLVTCQVNTHALRGDLRIADRDKGAPGGRTQQIQDRQRTQYGQHQAQVIELLAAFELPAEDVGCLHMHALVAARHRAPAGEYLLHDEPERQGGHTQINALHPQRRHTDHHAGGRRQCSCQHQRQRKRHSHIGQHGMGIRTHSQKGRMPDGKLPGEPGQQHQAQAGHRIDQHKGKLRQPVFGGKQRRQQQQQQ